MILDLFLLFLKLGALSIGGGYALMTLILTEGSKAVGLTAAEFADMAALELLASGPIVINASTYVGYIKGGFLGALVSTVAVIIPSTLLCIIIYYFINKLKDSKNLRSFMDAIQTATGGLMLSTALIIGRDIFVTNEPARLAISTPVGSINIISLVIGGIALLALMKFKVNPIKVILGSAVLGMIFL